MIRPPVDEFDDAYEPTWVARQSIKFAKPWTKKRLAKKARELMVDDLREREENFKRLKKKKEDVGVELYGVQQQLARMQLILEKTHDNFNMVRKMREQAEDETRSVFKEYEKKKAELAAQQKRMNTFQAELDKLNATLQQVEQYNDQMKGEIAITRRANRLASSAFSARVTSWSFFSFHRRSSASSSTLRSSGVGALLPAAPASLSRATTACCTDRRFS